ncbi:NAD(P)-binding protein [Schizophyllum commune Loenen D]|nr:NAD(P)-binding protein [Schizophyllum commune Loenen D]
MSTPTVYLITGTNRGLGFALVRLLATRPDVVIYASARKLDDAMDLKALASKSAGKIRLVELQSGDEAAHEAAIARIKTEVGRLDVVIANAGMVSHIRPMLDMPVQALRDHLEVNTIGPFVLFQAAYPLIHATHGKFAVISSWLGAERGANSPFGFTAYATSKAAVNFLVRRMHTECPDISTSAGLWLTIGMKAVH